MKNFWEFLKIVFWIGVIVISFTFIRWSWSLDNNQETKEDRPPTEADYAQIAKETCRMYIKQVLNDPDSAEWTRSSEWRVETDHEGTWAVYPTLRARNGFGALVLSKFKCEMFGLLGNFELRDLKEVQ